MTVSGMGVRVGVGAKVTVGTRVAASAVIATTVASRATAVADANLGSSVGGGVDADLLGAQLTIVSIARSNNMSESFLNMAFSLIVIVIGLVS